MNTIANNVDKYYDSWNDNTEVSNIRCRGSYPNVRHKPYKRRYHHGFIQCWNQHKPYGMSTMCYDPFDDRPDWALFRPRHRRRQYEEIMHNDPDFPEGMTQDHDMGIPHVPHVHIRRVNPDTYNEEIGDTIIV